MNEPRKHKALLDMSRRDLARWARNNAQRDELVRAAAASGLGKSEIFQITGIARTTIDRILAPAPASSSATPAPTPASSLSSERLCDPEQPREPVARGAGVPGVAAAMKTPIGDPEPEPVDEVVDDLELVAELDDVTLHRGRVVVVGCGADKLDHPAPAAELYTGSYFRACLSTALAIADRRDVRILSAKHGLLQLDDVIGPYDVTLGDPFDVIQPYQITEQALAQGLAGRRVLALCPARYADLLRRAGFTVDAPLAGLPIGKQRHVLAELRG